jgi:Leucine-rich repeat (LRR) protein
MKIIRKCGGLPLAIKVMGGLLSTKPQSETDWEAVLNHRTWSVDGLPEELDKRIYLSYEDLSPELKQCFLYCSLFPKGTSIFQKLVVPMWISEGFIQPQGGSSSHDDQLEEIGTEYYKELITRNLIEPTEGDTITRYSCTMHDVVRSFVEYMSREDSLVVQNSKQVATGSSLLVRRMSVGPVRELLLEEWAALQQQVSLRTLFIFGKINYKPGDSLTCFSRLRVLSINNGGECDMLVGSVCQLTHLRSLALEGTNISRLPENIHKMKFLQHIVLRGCMNLESLPSSIIKLVHLRFLDMHGLKASVIIPKGFGGLANLRILYGFPVHVDMDGCWCSLEEIGPLCQLRKLSLNGLQNVPASSLAEMARISSKEHLDYLGLCWSSSEWMELREEIKKQQQQHAAEEVLENLCPPPRTQHLHIEGYFGRMLPNWMTVPNAATWTFKSLMILGLWDLPCCTKLPDGLHQLPSLKILAIKDAPAIKRVGYEFQASSSLTAVGRGGTAATSAAAFPSLTHLILQGLCEWEEWDWVEQATVDVTAGTMAMPCLERLYIRNCKLRCLPPGLANSKRHALRELRLYEITNLVFVENFPSVVELDVFDCPELKRISGLSRLHKIRIVRCPNLEVLQGVPALDTLMLNDATMEALPGYLPGVNPRYFEVVCCKKLYESLSSPGTSVEWNKISHIRNRNIINIED